MSELVGRGREKAFVRGNKPGSPASFSPERCRKARNDKSVPEHEANKSPLLGNWKNSNEQTPQVSEKTWGHIHKESRH